MASPKVFRFQGNRAIYTIHFHIEVDDVKVAFSALFGRQYDQTKFKVLREVGKTGHKHTHVVVLHSKRVQFASSTKWSRFRSMVGDFNLNPISTDEHFVNCLQYSDSEKKDELVSKVIWDTIGEWVPAVPYHKQCVNYLRNVGSWAEALVGEFSEYISHRLNWAASVYDLCQMVEKYEFPDGKPRPWQQAVIKMLEQPPDDRTIWWFYDEKGGMGKSHLCNWLIDHMNAFLCDSGGQKDISYAYDRKPIVLFDLARDTKEYCPYRTMEGFKNGRLFSAKYKSTLKRFKIPHVVCFANYRPMFDKISADQWRFVDMQNPLPSEPEIDLIFPEDIPQGVPDNVKAPPAQKPKRVERGNTCVFQPTRALGLPLEASLSSKDASREGVQKKKETWWAQVYQERTEEKEGSHQRSEHGSESDCAQATGSGDRG